MKIAFVHQPIGTFPVPPGGSIAIWIHQVARRLARSCDVSVYARRGADEAETEVADGIRFRRLRVATDVRNVARVVRRLRPLGRLLPAELPAFAAPVHYLSYALRVAREVRDEGCDIVHIQSFSQFVPVVRRFHPGARIVLHMHCDWLAQLHEGTLDRRLRAADCIVGCSEHVTEGVRRRFPHLADRCLTVGNGVDTEAFSPARAAAPGSGKRLLFVGRISPEKGLHVLLDAFERLLGRHPDAKLRIVGPEWQTPRHLLLDLDPDPFLDPLRAFYATDRAVDYGSRLRARMPPHVANRVELPGFLGGEELVDCYRWADVLVNPSFRESFGMSLIEAMACGVPVVASRVGGMPELVDDGFTGLLVPPGDPAALARALDRLLEDPVTARRMGVTARTRATLHNDWERVTSVLWDCYGTLTGNRRPSPARARPRAEVIRG